MMRHTAIIAVLSWSAIAVAADATASLPSRPDVRDFVRYMVKKYSFREKELTSLFGEVQIRDDILTAIARPAEAKPWSQYRPIFVTDDRIKRGVEFWDQHASELEAAQREFGVPAQYLVGIIGVETRYGRHAGGYRVIDALSTLAFDYPPRSPFFRTQLEEFLVMAREEGIAPQSLKGSYAGAMGQPQFMPSSFRSWAVDFDGDGKRDLWNNTADAVGSVANYFHAHGWRGDSSVVHRATVTGDKYEALVTKAYETTRPFAELVAKGVTVDAAIPPAEKVSLLRLEGENGPEYWVARHNFFVITRYNHSAHYAMAVHQLGEAVMAARAAEAATKQDEEPRKRVPSWCPQCE